VGRPQLGPKAQPNCKRSTLADSGCQLVSMIPVDSERILAQDWCHWKLMKFCFQPYIERPKPTPYATWASVLLRTAPGLRTGLKLELLLASTSGTRTGSTLDLLVDLETLVGLLLLHSMHQSWSYAWVSCPHHSPLLDEKPSSASIVLGTDPAQHKSERGFENQRNQNYCEEECHHVSNW
jgi:hypothetical protein